MKPWLLNRKLDSVSGKMPDAPCAGSTRIDPSYLTEGVGRDVKEAIEILSLCGLNDAFLFLRRFKELSDGQKYRYKLAKLIDNREKNV